jgi:hypothetical protein
MVNYKKYSKHYNKCSTKVLLLQKKKLQDDYTKLGKPRTHMEMQKRASIICFLFKVLSFFNLSTPSGMFFTIKHLLIMWAW